MRYTRLALLLPLLLWACGDPTDRLPKPQPGPPQGQTPGTIIAAFENIYYTLNQPWHYWGPQTANHYEVSTGTVYMTRGSALMVMDPIDGDMPAQVYSIVLDNIDLDKLPIPFIFGSTPTPPGYPYAYPQCYVLHRSYTPSLPTWEISTQGTTGGVVLYAAITSRNGDELQGTFTGEYWDSFLQQYVTVNDGQFRIQLARR